jgi:hypothetical protein
VRAAHFKGKKRAGWVPVRISTDGIKLCVTYESATHRKAANLDALAQKGYNWSAPRARVDGATPGLRGVYRASRAIRQSSLQTAHRSRAHRSAALSIRPIPGARCFAIPFGSSGSMVFL